MSWVAPDTDEVVEKPKAWTPPSSDEVVASQKNFERRIQNPEKYIKNSDGSVSTHKMASAEFDGKQVAFPTIVEQNGKLVELPIKDAVDYARKTGEFKEFKTEKEAQDYAEGGYKKGTPLENFNPNVPHLKESDLNDNASLPKMGNAGLDLIHPAFLPYGLHQDTDGKIKSVKDIPAPTKDAFSRNPFQSEDKSDSPDRSAIEPITEGLSDIAISPVVQGVQGIKEGSKEIANAAKNMGNPLIPVHSLTAKMQMAEGIAKTAFGALNVAPPVALFTMGTTAAGKVVPEKYMNYVFAPLQTIIDPQSEMGKAAAGLGDIGINLLAIHGLGKVGDLIKEGKELTPDQVNESAQAIGNSKPEEIKKAASDFVVDNLHSELKLLKQKEINLQSDANNLVPVMGEDAKTLFAPEIEKTQQELQGKQIQLETIDKLEKALPLASEEGKKIITNQLNKLKPKEDANNQEQIKTSVQEERESGNQVGEENVPSGSNSLLGAEESKEKIVPSTLATESNAGEIKSEQDGNEKSSESSQEGSEVKSESNDGRQEKDVLGTQTAEPVSSIVEKFPEEVKAVSDANRIAKAAGFSDATHVLNSLRKRGYVDAEGKPYERVQDVPKIELKKIKVERAKETTGIKHEDTKAVREEYGLGEHEKNPDTQKGWEAAAEKKIKEGYDVDELLTRLEKGNLPTPVEQKILQKYIANVESKVNDNPSDANLTELRRLVEAGDRAAGSIVAKSLVARKGVEKIDDSLSDYFMHEMDLNNGAPLTEVQKKTVIKEFGEISEAKAALEDKLSALQDELNKSQAQRQVNRARGTKGGIRKSHEDFVTERKKIAADISDKLKKFRGQTQATAIPYLNELIAISPDVAKMVKSYVEEGVFKLEDVVKNIHDELKAHIPDVTDKDVRALIAGEYAEKKVTRNETAKKLVDLKTQARLIGQLEKLLTGEEPKVEKKKVERNQEIQKLREQIKDIKSFDKDVEQLKEAQLSKAASENKSLEKELVSPEEKALGTFKKRINTLISKTEEALKGDNFEKIVKPKLKLDKAATELKDKYIKLKQEREIRIMRQQYANRSRYERTRDKLTDIANVPRTIMSSMDFSAPLRQGIVASTAHPIVASRAFAEMFRQSVSQKRFDRWFHDVKEDPLYPRSKEAGLYIADPHDPRLSVKEEAFMNNLAEKIPVVGKLIKGSERAYVGYLNKMRWDLFHQFADKLESEGKTFDNSPEIYKGLADYVNNSTGRGKIGALENYASALNTLFFAPRLIASRLNFLNPVYYAKLSKEVRVSALKDAAKFIGVGLSVLALAKLNGAEVEDDPRSSDFGKIKSGNTRWDIWGGHQQYIRVLTQMFTGKAESAKTGKIRELDGKGAFGETPGDVAGRFLRGKLAPISSIAFDIAFKRTLTGDQTTLGLEAEQHLLPLLFNDVQDAIKDQGVQGIFTAGIPSTFGVGVQTYSSKKKK